MELSADAFEALVVEALDELPDTFVPLLENVQIVVEDEPEGGADILGLYEGIPQTERNDNYTFVMPDKITLFRGPLLRMCEDEDDLYDEIAVTIVHEVAHHFGISDERLEELGWA